MPVCHARIALFLEYCATNATGSTACTSTSNQRREWQSLLDSVGREHARELGLAAPDLPAWFEQIIMAERPIDVGPDAPLTHVREARSSAPLLVQADVVTQMPRLLTANDLALHRDSLLAKLQSERPASAFSSCRTRG